MKNIIIFGGTGFIGTNLAKRLYDEGNRILVIDNLQTSTLDNSKKLFWNNNCWKDNYNFIQFDITGIDDYHLYNMIDDYFGGINGIRGNVDEIYNLACPASPPKYQDDPIHTLDTNIAVRDICFLAKSYNAKLLQSSTSEVYGNPSIPVQNEEYRGYVNCIGPRSCYDEGKRVAETYLYEWHKKGLDCKIVRIFNTYGTYMAYDDGRVISNFVWQALHNQDITIYGDGNQNRSFQYIDDLVDGLIKLMESDKFGPYNIGNPLQFTIKELAEIVLKKIPESTSKIVYCDLPVDDPIQRKPDILKAKNDLDWSPKISLDLGLDKTIEYFRSQM